ncbi:MAG: excinuclease ABC subunit UvrC, partial [Thermodesulfobacteriota bacterium]
TKFSNRLRPCINYEMGRCLGPCCHKIDSVQYRRIIQQVRMFLEGMDKELIESLRRRMEEESEQLHFEQAAKIRDQIASIEHVIEKQRVVSPDLMDQDVIGFHRKGNTVIIHRLFGRGGKLLGGKGFKISSFGIPDEEILSSFIHQYYKEGRFIPERILIPIEIPEVSLVEQWLTELKGEKVQVLVPLKGDKRGLIKMASENAEKFLLRESEIEKDQERVLEALKERLHLRKIPRIIEAFDISDLQGGYAVGSMVCFENGQPAKDRYRHFKIRTIEGMDDYGMMYEVLFRRYGKGGDFPDLVLIDGGKGQLNVAQEVLKELQIREMDLLGIAKERVKKAGSRSSVEKTEEKIFHPQFKEPFILGKESSLLHFLDRIRDEAHRFAITYHKKVRKRETIKSELEEIPGVGEKRRNELLRYFGSVENIKRATLEVLFQAPKMNKRLAQEIYKFFHKGEEEV